MKTKRDSNHSLLNNSQVQDLFKVLLLFYEPGNNNTKSEIDIFLFIL